MLNSLNNIITVEDLYLLDFLHHPSSFPNTKKASSSILGIIISLIYIFFSFYYIFREMINYRTRYTITSSQEILNANDFINHNLTFGFKVEDTYYKSTLFSIYDSSNKLVDINLMKKCDENLNEIKEIKDNENYYTCFFDYPLSGNNKTSHFIKLILDTYERHNFKKISLIVKVKEPTINHNENNPLMYNENNGISELIFNFYINREISYRKYLKIIDYKSIDYKSSDIYSGVILEEFEDSSMYINNDRCSPLTLGKLHIFLSNKKEVIERKYVLLTKFISEIGGYLNSMRVIFSLIVLILVNPNDNLRIYNSIQRNKPFLKNQSSVLIKDYSEKKNGVEILENINKKITFIDKCSNFFYFYFFICIKKKKIKGNFLSAINSYVRDKLTINNYLADIIINDLKEKKIKEFYEKTEIPFQIQDDKKKNEYLKNEFIKENSYNTIESEEIKIKIDNILYNKKNNNEKLSKENKEKNNKTKENKSDIEISTDTANIEMTSKE